ncbi:MAG: V-type ATP synthase subunit E [Firmicutes bacterium ADurb.Bin193]|nr:MAG: V-type ATP synthase subunit E [Firmicutes bacterium ADurb.Bin193]
MTGLEGITQKILDDARQNAEHILTAAKNRAKEIEAANAADMALRRENILKQTEQNAALKAERIVAAAQLEAKKAYLAAKQEIIDDAFAKAAAHLASLDDSEYDALIRDMSKGVEGEIIPLPRDKKAGTGGGFIVKNGRIEYNFSFEALLKNAKERLEGKLVSILFG